MQHKTEWMGHPMRLKLIRVGLLVKLANHYTPKVPFDRVLYMSKIELFDI